MVARGGDGTRSGPYHVCVDLDGSHQTVNGLWGEKRGGGMSTELFGREAGIRGGGRLQRDRRSGQGSLGRGWEGRPRDP